MVVRKAKAAYIKNNGLTICMFSLFLLFLIGLSIAGLSEHNQNLASHHQGAISYWSYIRSGDFIEAVFENWESEFLQMAALVIATIFLRQQGAADSKRLRGKEKEDLGVPSRYSIIKGSLRGRTKAARHVLYANSLSLALVALFLVSFALHALGGVSTYNQTALQHGGATASVWQYIGTSQFWFESFQNWQSEFLAVAVLLVFSIFLRQQGSPESKPVNDPDNKTGR